jgi:hypothetical protein
MMFPFHDFPPAVSISSFFSFDPKRQISFISVKKMINFLLKESRNLSERGESSKVANGNAGGSTGDYRKARRVYP